MAEMRQIELSAEMSSSARGSEDGLSGFSFFIHVSVGCEILDSIDMFRSRRVSRFLKDHKKLISPFYVWEQTLCLLPPRVADPHVFAAPETYGQILQDPRFLKPTNVCPISLCLILRVTNLMKKVVMKVERSENGRDEKFIQNFG
jgi:hypothetical protein